MTKQNRDKLNRLHRLLPEGFIADAAWLTAAGYPSSLRSQYLKSGWLQRVTRGVYRRPLHHPGVDEAVAPLSWQHVVASLQLVMKQSISVGERTALELNGYAHYVSSGSPREIHLYGDERASGWLGQLPIETSFVFHNAKKLFPTIPISKKRGLVGDGSVYRRLPNLTDTRSDLDWFRFGTGDWPIYFSTPERAVLEILDELPDKETFEQVDVLVESLVNISPRRMVQLLQECRSIKVKRLFFWFADRHKHAWLERMERDGLELGSGKRMLVKGGKLDPKYLITVPAELDDRV